MNENLSHVLLTGGTGFVGTHLIDRLLRGRAGSGASAVEGRLLISVLTREPDDAVKQFRQQYSDLDTSLAPQVSSDPKSFAANQRHGILCVDRFDQLAGLATPDAVINLAGAGIADKRWSDSRKQVLRDSRIHTTEKLVGWLTTLDKRPRVLVSASAVGFYGAQGDKPVTDDTAPHQEFQHELCRDWELAALQAEKLGLRVFIPRIAPVLGRDTEGNLAGFLKRLVPPFRFGLGGPISDGQHWMPWIHVSDLCRLILTALDDEHFSGPVLACAPDTRRNADFTKALASTLHRPAVLPLPAFALKLGFGEMSRLLLTGQQAIPKAVEALGFKYDYPTLDEALKAVLG
ncbi:MAG: TIGR01777 family protein [unclassified Hahellaceae]|nr:TIGR01777 family protein [Hahellaceae bacterium]|tara:strand:+ start:35784 stop:36821 length:1038 start_codon:yes stop_codon:yes gene_type:complete